MKIEVFSVITNGAQYSEHAKRTLPSGPAWVAGRPPAEAEVVRHEQRDISHGIIVGAWCYVFWREVQS